jgi:hypothetical protein
VCLRTWCGEQQWENVAEEWRKKLQIKKLFNNLYCAPNITSNQIIMDEMGGNVARAEEIRNAYTILVENLKFRDIVEYLHVDGRIILKWKYTECELHSRG